MGLKVQRKTGYCLKGKLHVRMVLRVFRNVTRNVTQNIAVHSDDNTSIEKVRKIAMRI